MFWRSRLSLTHRASDPGQGFGERSKCVLSGCRTLLPFDWCDESVSATCQSFNVLGMVGIVCERLAEDRDGDVNASIEFHDGIVRPKNLPYFLAGNNFALPLHQDSQNLKGLLAEQDLYGPSFRRRRSDGDEFTGSDVEL